MKNRIIGKISMMVLCALCTTEISAQPGYARDNDITIAYEAFGNAADPAFLLIQGTCEPAVLVGDYCDRREQLSHINIPTLVIHGDADPMVPLEAGLEVHQAIPGAALCTIKGMGHDISLRFVNSLVDCMADFAAVAVK